MANQLLSTLRALRSLPAMRERLDALADRVATLSATTERAAAMAEEAHRALSGADPRQALDIVTATRDELRRLSIDLTEQMNRLSQAAGIEVGSAAAPQGQVSGSS